MGTVVADNFFSTKFKIVMNLNIVSCIIALYEHLSKLEISIEKKTKCRTEQNSREFPRKFL